MYCFRGVLSQGVLARNPLSVLLQVLGKRENIKNTTSRAGIGLTRFGFRDGTGTFVLSLDTDALLHCCLRHVSRFPRKTSRTRAVLRQGRKRSFACVPSIVECFRNGEGAPCEASARRSTLAALIERAGHT